MSKTKAPLSEFFWAVRTLQIFIKLKDQDERLRKFLSHGFLWLMCAVVSFLAIVIMEIWIALNNQDHINIVLVALIFIIGSIGQIGLQYYMLSKPANGRRFLIWVILQTILIPAWIIPPFVFFGVLLIGMIVAIVVWVFVISWIYLCLEDYLIQSVTSILSVVSGCVLTLSGIYYIGQEAPGIIVTIILVFAFLLFLITSFVFMFKQLEKDFWAYWHENKLSPIQPIAKFGYALQQKYEKDMKKSRYHLKHRSHKKKVSRQYEKALKRRRKYS